MQYYLYSLRLLSLYIAYGITRYFASAQIGDFVPKSNLSRRSKNLGLVDEIYNIAELQLCV